MTRHPSATTLDHVLDELADRIADRLLKLSVGRTGDASATSEWYDQHQNPLGKRRFLEAARHGAFPSTREGKQVLARRDDVDRWIASRGRTPTQTTAVAPRLPADLSDEEILAANGVELVPARCGGRR